MTNLLFVRTTGGIMNFTKVAAFSPVVHIGNIEENIKEIAYGIKNVDDLNAADIIVTPELSLTGYTCQDYFLNNGLIDKLEVRKLIPKLRQISSVLKNGGVAVVGAPLVISGSLFNCALVLDKNGLVGVVPKCYIPNYGEFYEKRWFTSALNKNIPQFINYGDNLIPVGTNLIFQACGTKFGIEICEDLWAPKSPSTDLALGGADIILNLSASNEIVGKSEYRRDLVKMQSGKCICGYVYCSAGSSESTSDVVFSGHNIIADNGTILCETDLFNCEASIAVSDIDVDKIRHDRLVNTTFSDSGSGSCRLIGLGLSKSIIERPLHRKISLTPFIPEHGADDRCREIFNIQTEGLARRWENTGSNKLVVGVSGGLDSTLALLVAVGAADKLGYSRDRVLGVTMPCFGTSSRTKNNAIKLMEELGCEMREVNIGLSVEQHLADIGLSRDDRSVAFENAQARERTQVLMDIANMVGGFVVGTGDLSELALGWCTYNGDHMSMYSVNGSIPKTLVRSIVKTIGMDMSLKSLKCGDNNNGLRDCIIDILETPVSPELLPPSADGKIAQLTEDSVGPYVLNDFFIYHLIRCGRKPLDIYRLCIEAVKNSEYNFSNEEILKWLKKFYQRFARAQFKRNCCPDGVKVGSVSFNPRGDWRMPSELDVRAALKELDQLN